MPKTSYMPPEASLAAYSQVKTKKKDSTNRDIVYNTLLLKLRNKMGTASDIALHCTLDYHEVNRRVKELIKEKRIYIFSQKGGRSMGDNPCRIYKVCDGSQTEQDIQAANAEAMADKVQGSFF